MADKVKDPADKGMIRVLVYGTLKEGHSNHGLLEQADAEFIGYDSFTGAVTLYDMGAIPAVMDDLDLKNDNRIRGELWAMGPEGLASLDLLEGHPHLYARRKIRTDVHDRNAWIYVLMSQNFLPKNCGVCRGGLWNGSVAENKFWLKQNAA